MEIKQHTGKQPQRRNERVNRKTLDGKHNTRYQNLWNAAEAVLLGRIIAINTYIKS